MREITEQIEQKVFQLYIGCEVMALDVEGEKRKAYITGIHGEYQLEVQFIDDNGNVSESPEYCNYRDATILVTPLYVITDEDAIEVASIMDHQLNCTMDSSITTIKEHAYQYCRASSEITDLLRLKDYATDCYGYSVDELIKANIFKLKQ